MDCAVPELDRDEASREIRRVGSGVLATRRSGNRAHGACAERRPRQIYRSRNGRLSDQTSGHSEIVRIADRRAGEAARESQGRQVLAQIETEAHELSFASVENSISYFVRYLSCRQYRRGPCSAGFC
jgi:hypothetical protein